MAATVKALRGFWCDRRIVRAGEIVACDDAVAADLLISGKAEPADEKTRKRWAQARPANTWSEPSDDRAAPQQFAVGWRARTP